MAQYFLIIAITTLITNNTNIASTAHTRFKMLVKTKNYHQYFWGCLLLIAYLLIVNSAPQNYSEFINLGFTDTQSYLAIAHTHSFSSLNELTNRYLYHHLERWPAHLFVGFLANFLNLSDLVIYRYLTILCALFSAWLISNINSSTANKLMYFALVVLNPYTFMTTLFAPPMLSDCLYTTSMVALAVGLFQGQYKFIYVSLILGILSRQTSILILPIVLASAYFLPRLRNELLKFLIISFFLLAVFYYLNKYLLGSNPSPMNVAHITGLYTWLLNPDRASFLFLLASIGGFLLTISPLVFLNLNKYFFPIALLGFIIISSQPILAGPSMTGGNAARLIAFSLPLLGLAFIGQSKSAFKSLAFIGLLMLNALHHNYSNVFLIDEKINYLILLIVTTLISLMIKLFFQWRHRRNA